MILNMYDFIYYDIKNAKTYFNMTFLFLTVTILVASAIFCAQSYMKTHVSSKTAEFNYPKILTLRNSMFRLSENSDFRITFIFSTKQSKDYRCQLI